MATKILLILGLIALTWWWTRPLTRRRPLGSKQQASLVRCEHCGVYHEEAKPCQCKGDQKKKAG